MHKRDDLVKTSIYGQIWSYVEAAILLATSTDRVTTLVKSQGTILMAFISQRNSLFNSKQ